LNAAQGLRRTEQPDARFEYVPKTHPNANMGKNHQRVRKTTKDMNEWRGEEMNQLTHGRKELASLLNDSESRKEGMKNRGKKQGWVNDNGGVEQT